MGAAVCAQKTPIVQSRTIDRALAREKDNEKATLKLLLLGTGECGKSTIFKQLRIIHDNNFGTLEKEAEKRRIYSNIYHGMADLCEGVDHLQIGPQPKAASAVARRWQSFTHPSWKTLKNDAMLIQEIIGNNKHMEPISYEAKRALKNLWKDKRIREAYERRSELQVTDSIGYFLDNLDRICAPDYSPSNEDYLNLRIPTTGVVEIRLNTKGSDFRFVDVGGQRSERKKWLSQFEDVGAIIFLSAISEYDQLCNEDSQSNRLEESMKLFYTMANSSYFTNTTIILFLNKTDLFTEKIQKKSIKCYFKDYSGADTFEDTTRYIESEFVKLAPRKKKGSTLFTHLTCATDTNQVKVIIDSVLDAVIQHNLMKAGIIDMH